MSHQVETKMVQNRGDKRRGSFCFREKDDIRAIGSDQCLEISKCSWTSNPYAVPRQDLHMMLGDTTWSPKLMESSFSNTAKMA
jgi:hypothetical protein